MATKVGLARDLPIGSVEEVQRYAVGNNGAYFAVSRRCRHLGGNLADGSLDADGCLVCPWHQAKYDVTSGRMVRGPQGIFAKIPGLGATFKALTAVLPLRRVAVSQRGDDLYLDD
ncbi:MAG TPA: Rieske (2Fe-2S) protein [Jatrophihabitantaceae bacterium]|jgi:nitrite reductase/ring-hydroxylating ferredoxin subunit|nr:Rieske (2Fe-2S) protein [Jatrophihabitantaceae bacterium]